MQHICPETVTGIDGDGSTFEQTARANQGLILFKTQNILHLNYWFTDVQGANHFSESVTHFTALIDRTWSMSAGGELVFYAAPATKTISRQGTQPYKQMSHEDK